MYELFKIGNPLLRTSGDFWSSAPSACLVAIETFSYATAYPRGGGGAEAIDSRPELLRELRLASHLRARDTAANRFLWCFAGVSQPNSSALIYREPRIIVPEDIVLGLLPSSAAVHAAPIFSILCNTIFIYVFNLP